jgi:glycosyltransferase involved in cell wall biosynthesis
MSDVVYGCCVGSWTKFEKYVQPQLYASRSNDNRRCITRFGASAIAPAYNTILNELCGTRDLPDMLILLHDDLEITDENAEEKFLNALEADVALVGVCGGGGESLYWWEHSPVGHQLTDVMNIDFGQRTGDVELIEGSIMVFSRWAIANLRFDTRFTDFHGYDEIAAQARALGKRVVVADVDTHHHNPMGYKSPESAAACRLANELYREKWKLT